MLSAYGISLAGLRLRLPPQAAYLEVRQLFPVLGAHPSVLGMIALHARPCIVLQSPISKEAVRSGIQPAAPEILRLITLNLTPYPWAVLVDEAPQRIEGSQVVADEPPWSFLDKPWSDGAQISWRFEPQGLLDWLREASP